MIFDPRFAWSILPQLAKAAEVTVLVTIASFSFSICGGLVLLWLRMSSVRAIANASNVFSDFIRGTPLLLQVFILFYLAPYYGIVLSPIQTGILAIGVHFSCYMSEVYRTALKAVPRGQWEAAHALGLSPFRTFQKVIFPQMFPVVVPIAGSYLVYMFKDTPILSAITVRELMQVSSRIGATHFRYMEPLTIVGLLFLVMSVASAYIFRSIERAIAIP